MMIDPNAVQAAQMLLSYKRGALSRDQVFGLLIEVIGMLPSEVDAALAHTDKMPVQYLERQERAWFDSQKASKH
jgi:hypothetical protein